MNSAQKISLQVFFAEALEPDAYLRKGQKFINHLSLHRKDIYEALIRPHPSLDCFYDDSRLWSNVDLVIQNWDREFNDVIVIDLNHES
jgi:hypothetical protein